MIDTVIEALHQNGIYEIYVVVWHLKEQFEGLRTKYPGVILVENPFADTCNNISSLYVVRDHIADAIILDGDQIIHDGSLLKPEFPQSCYCCTYTENHTKEWLLTLDKNGTVCHCKTDGGPKGWQLYSVSFWTLADGRRLAEKVAYEFENGNKDIYWDNVPLLLYPDEFKLSVRPIVPGMLVELDTIAELADFDPAYQAYL